MSLTAAELVVLLTARDEASRVFAQVGANGQSMAHQVDTALKGAATVGITALAGISVAAYKAAADFQASQSVVKAATQASAEEMKRLKEQALDLGKATIFSASEVSAAQAELAKAGVGVSDILGGALKGSLDLAAAGQMGLADAAVISANAMNAFGLEATDVTHIADVLAAGANKSAADMAGLGLALQQSSLVAHQYGLTLEDTVGLLSAFADRGLKGSDAGTSLKTMLQRLTPTSKEAAEMMAQLGLDFYDAQGQFVGIETVAGQLREALGGLTEEERNLAMTTIFGSDAVRGANVLYELGAEGVKEYTDAVNDAGAAQRTAAELTNNANGAWEQFMGTMEVLAIELGDHFLPIMTTILLYLAENLPAAVEWLKENFGPAFEAGATAAQVLVEALRPIGDFLAENSQLVSDFAMALGLVVIEMVALGAAMLVVAAISNPFVLIIAGLVALQFAILEAVKHWDEIDAAISGFADDVRDGMGDAVDAVADGIGDMVGAAADGVADVAGEFADLPGEIVGELADLPGEMYDIGLDIADGLLQGAIDGAQDLLGEVASWPGEIVDAIKDAADGHSPWGIMKSVGADIVAGMGLGFDSAAPAMEARVMSFAAGLAAKATRVVNSVQYLPGGVPGYELLGDAALDINWDYGQSTIYDLINSGGAARSDQIPPGLQGPFLGMSQADIELANRRAREAGAGVRSSYLSGLNGGGGGGSGGDSDVSAAVTAFLGTINYYLTHEATVDKFGEAGAVVAEAMSAALAEGTKAAGKDLAQAVHDLIEEAKAEGVENAAELGQALIDAMAEAMRSGSAEAAQAAQDALTAVTDAIKAAGQLTKDSLADAMGSITADKALSEAVGSTGRKLLDALDKALQEGGKKNIATLAGITLDIRDALADGLPPGQAAYIGTEFMSALNRAIEEGSPEAIAALQGTLGRINDVMHGAAIDIRTGMVIVKETIGSLAKDLGVSSADIVDNIQVIIDAGLVDMVGSIKKLPTEIRAVIAEILADLAAGKIAAEDAAGAIAGAVGAGGTGKGGAGGSDALVPTGKSIRDIVRDIVGFDFFAGEGKIFDSAGFALTPGDIHTAVTHGYFDDRIIYGDWTYKKNSKIPGYASGIDYVPYDQLAFIHQGEAVVPASENRGGRGGGSPTIVIQAVDTQSFDMWLRSGGGDTIASYLEDHDSRSF